MLDNKTKISVVNKRGQDYTASLPNGEYYEWMPAVGGIEDSHDLEFKQVQYLHMRSSTFREGYLYIDNEEARKRLGLEKEEVKVATMSHDEIEKLLKGNLTQLKKLENYKDNSGFIREVVEVAKNLKVSNVNKLSYLSELSGVPVDVIRESYKDEE
ncbi:hypothetical protein ABEY43_06485 [Priestia megaterium]